MTINYLTPVLVHLTLRSFDPIETPVLTGWEQDFVVLTKTPQGTYEEVATCSTASEAWAARRTLATSDKERKFFVRSRRLEVVAPSSPEAREDRDLWQDAWKTGNDHLVPADQQASYKVWAAKKTTNIYARFQTNRDAPRWEGGNQPPSLGGDFQSKSWGGAL